MLTLASYLAENVQPLYERLATWLAARFGEPATLLDDGRVHVAYLCGWLYAQRHDRPERSVDLLCAPVMAAPRYEDRSIYFTGVVSWSSGDREVAMTEGRRPCRVPGRGSQCWKVCLRVVEERVSP